MSQHFWYVSAPHKVGVGIEEPYGVQHARQPGKPVTECGAWALNWPIFWDRPFHSDEAQVCRACARRVATADYKAPRLECCGADRMAVS